MTFIWLPVQNISVDLVQLQNKYMWELLQTHPFSGSGAQHWLWEWRTPISCYRNYFKSPVTYFFFFSFFWTTFLQEIIPKYKSVYPESRGGQIHGYSLCLKSFSPQVTANYAKQWLNLCSPGLRPLPETLGYCVFSSSTSTCSFLISSLPHPTEQQKILWRLIKCFLCFF